MSDLLRQRTDFDELTKQLSGLGQSTWNLDPQQMRAALGSRVRGQDHVLDDLAPLICPQYGKIYRKKPVANLMFVGHTGTGKTELCRALAEHLFGDENAAVFYDCGELKYGGSLTRLIGTTPGYTGGSGELTTKLQANKRRIIVFDEIEKAHSDICDLFLAMMGEGRLTDQRTGKAADLTESIIVLSSNAQHDELDKLQQEIRDPNELNNAVRVQLREAAIFRPEIIGRLTRIYVFKQLEGIVRAEIAFLKMRKMAQEYGLDVDFVAPELLCNAVQAGDKLKDFGARQRDQVIEDMLAEPLLAARRAGAKSVKLALGKTGDILVEPSLSSAAEAR
jgi:ATP-dependent Clp protease ATP-binding subunit ClpA